MECSFFKRTSNQKVVTITNTAVVQVKNTEGGKCSGDFFPSNQMKIEKVREMNLSGVRVIKGFWREGYKYVILSCANTVDGYKVSSAFIRLPFLKRTMRATTLIQLGFFNDSKLKLDEEREFF